ncbi:MAG: DUF5009 domain-containing protein [Ginsengibacter sp.]
MKERFLALDVFRGMTICFMIIVNTPGSGADPFSPLEHANWHGFTPTDLVFPSFLFAVGNAMSFSLKKYEQIGNNSFFKKIFKRTVLIFLIGYLMSWFPFFEFNSAGDFILSPIGNTRILGVLQRIALSYFFGSLLVHFLSPKKLIIASVLLLIGYWLLLIGFGDPLQPFSLLGNADLHLDKFLMGNDHLYHGERIPFDPEGWLGTLPSIVNVVIGFLAGGFIRKNGKTFECISKLMMVGVALIFLALWWDFIFPINKKLWSSSFVLLTCGLDLIIISLLIYILEMRKWNPMRWSGFFEIFGKNPLFIYVLSELFLVVLFITKIGGKESVFNYINRVLFQVVASGPIGSLLFAVCFMLFCWSIGWLLNAKKIYVRV